MLPIISFIVSIYQAYINFAVPQYVGTVSFLKIVKD